MRCRTIRGLVVSTILLSSLTFAATYGGGSGTPEDPYQIWTPEQMNAIGANSGDWGKSFILMVDIDMSKYSGTQYNIIGKAGLFKGTFDGNKHKISNLRYTNNYSTGYVGLFGYIFQATIKNLDIVNIDIISQNGYIAGGLVGHQKDSIISNCHITGTMRIGTATSNADAFTSCIYSGGLVGYQDKGVIDGCSSFVSITCSINKTTDPLVSSYRICAGGLAGISDGAITNSFALGSLYASCYPCPDSYVCVGGLVGKQNAGSVFKCYSAGSVTATSCSSYSESYAFAGGLIGEQGSASISSCYSTCSATASATNDSSFLDTRSYCFTGGLIGQQNSGVIKDCYSAGPAKSNVNNASYLCSWVGGLVGSQQTSGMIINSYSISEVKATGLGTQIVGGLVGISYGGVVNSFWDIETSNLDKSAGGKGRTTNQLQQSLNYIGWNTSNQYNWVINENYDYPRLIWENQPAKPLPVNDISDFLTGEGTIENPHKICTPQQLNIIGLFPDQWNKYFCLMNDIDMAGIDYNKIGVSSISPFSGSIDGNGFIVFNLTYTTGAERCVGLLGYAINSVIKNIGLQNIDILANGQYTGGLVGYQKKGLIINCYSFGSVNSSTHFSFFDSSSYVGTLVGYLDNGTIDSCYSSGHITAVSTFIDDDYFSGIYAGGLVGYQSNGRILACHSTGSVNASALNTPQDYRSLASTAGGLVGGQATSSIIACYSTASVTAYSSSYSTSLYSSVYAYAGGLVGTASGTIDSCYSMGSVTASGVTPYSQYYVKTGGLVGNFVNGSICRCYSTGSATASGTSSDTTIMEIYSGGVVGYLGGRLADCYSVGHVECNSRYSYAGGLVGCQESPLNSIASIDNSYSIGSVSGTGRNIRIGGLIGRLISGTINNCFWDIQKSERHNSIGDGSSLGITGTTSSEMKKLSTFNDKGWDFTNESANGTNNIWRMCADGAIDYPRLNWESIRGDFVCSNSVGVEDLDYLLRRWLMTECNVSNNFCGGADLNISGMVDLPDFAVFAEHWLEEGYIAPALPSPIAVWKMDEIEGTVVADSIGGHEGQTVNIAGNPWQAGYHGYALKLDGINDYVQVTGFKGITGTASRTCSAWIKATASSKDQVIVSWGNEVAGQKWMFRLQTDGRLGVVVWNGYIQSSVSVADGQWHHVAAVLADDGSPSINEVKLYVDGLPQIATYSSTQPIDTLAGQDVQIGAFYNGSAQAGFFNGLLDDVRIYNLGLDENQIYRLSME